MMIPWLSNWRNEVVVPDRYLTWTFGYAWSRSCGCPGTLARTRSTLNARFLEVRYSFQTILHWHGLQPTILFASSFNHTHKVLSILSKGSWWCTQKIITPDGQLALNYPDTVVISLIQWTTDLFKVCWYPTTEMFTPTPISNLHTLPLPLPKISLSFPFYP
jgi:hypothetical protein